MVYQDKIDRVREVISDHNSNVGKEDQVDFEKFLSCLKKAGGTTESTLSECTWEDLEDCGLPKLLAKRVASVFRSSDNQEVKVVSAKKADKMSLAELVTSFDPEDVSSPVARRLKEISNDQPFIVYKNGRIVDITETLTLISDIKAGFPAITEITTSDGDVKKVYKIGQLPSNLVDENPLYPGLPLRRDVCSQTGKSWTNISISTRQLVRVIYDVVYKGRINIDIAHNLIQQASSSNAEKELKLKYRQAAIEFDRLKEHDSLPKLKMTLGQGGGVSKKSESSSASLAVEVSKILDGKKVAWVKTFPGHYNYRCNKPGDDHNYYCDNTV